MNAALGQAIATVALVGTCAGLSLAILTARRPLPVRVGFDLLRIAITVGTVVVMAAMTGISTPGSAIAGAVALGGTLGYVQGRKLEVEDREGRLFVTRTAFAIAVWGVGVVFMQTAGMLSRSGMLQAGQAVAYFGVGTTIGTFGGRTVKIDEMRKAASVVVAVVALIMAGGVMMIADAEPALAFHGGDHPGCVADGYGGYFCGPQEPESQTDVCELTGECGLPEADTTGPAPPPSPPSEDEPTPTTRDATGDDFCRDNGFEPDRDGDGACDISEEAGADFCRDNGFEPDRDGDGRCDLRPGAGDDYCRDNGLEPDRNGDGVCDLSAEEGAEFCVANGFEADADGDGVCDVSEEAAGDYCTANGFASDADGDGVCDLPEEESGEFCVANGFAPDADGDGVCDLPDDGGAAFCVANGFEPDGDGDGVCDLPLQTASVTTAPLNPDGDDPNQVEPDENAAQSAGGAAGAGLLGVSGLVETLGRSPGGGNGRGGRGRGGPGGRGDGSPAGGAGTDAGPARRTTVYLTGKDAEDFLERSGQTAPGQTMVGEEVAIPPDQQHGVDISVGDQRHQEDPIGRRGRVVGVGARVEGPDGETVIAVEVDVSDPSVDSPGEPTPPVAPPPPVTPAAAPASAPQDTGDTFTPDEIDDALDQGLDDLAGLDLGGSGQPGSTPPPPAPPPAPPPDAAAPLSEDDTGDGRFQSSPPPYVRPNTTLDDGTGTRTPGEPGPEAPAAGDDDLAATRQVEREGTPTPDTREAAGGEPPAPTVEGTRDGLPTLQDAEGSEPPAPTVEGTREGLPTLEGAEGERAPTETAGQTEPTAGEEGIRPAPERPSLVSDPANVRGTPGVAGDGTIHDPNGRIIGRVDASGQPLDLDHNPVSLVVDPVTGGVRGIAYPPLTEGGEPRVIEFQSDGTPRQVVYPDPDAPRPTTGVGVFEPFTVDENGRMITESGRDIGYRATDGTFRTDDGRVLNVQSQRQANPLLPPPGVDVRDAGVHGTDRDGNPIMDARVGEQQVEIPLFGDEATTRAPDADLPRTPAIEGARSSLDTHTETYVDAQGNPQTRPISPQALADAVGAGADNQLTAQGGSRVGVIDRDGNIWTGDQPGEGQRVTGVQVQEGRVTEFHTDDGMTHYGDGRPPTPTPSAPALGDTIVSEGLAPEDMRTRSSSADIVGRVPGPDWLQGDPGQAPPPPMPDADAPPPPPPPAETRQVTPPPVDDPNATRQVSPPTDTPPPPAPADADAPPPPAAETRQVTPPPADDPNATRQVTQPGGDDAPRTSAGDTPTTRDRAASTVGRLLDAKQAHDLYEQHVADGMSPSEALATTAAQMGAGEATGRAAGLDLGTGFAGGALLPGGMQNVMPDQFVVNAAGTGADFVRAAATSLGEGDTAALGQFWDSVVARGGGDPFSGYAQAAELALDEWNRADGGNLASDLWGLYAGENADVGWGQVADDLGEFHERLQSGEYGAPLQGLTQIGDATLGTAAEFAADPSGTLDRLAQDARQLGTDLGTMFDQTFRTDDSMLFDGELWREFGTNTERAVRGTPIVGALYDLGGSAGTYLRSFF